MLRIFKLILPIFFLLFEGVVFADVDIVNCASDYECSIYVFRSDIPDIFTENILTIEPDADEVPESNEVVFTLNDVSYTVTCDGSWETLKTSETSNALIKKISCSVPEERTTVEVKVAFSDLDTYNNVFSNQPSEIGYSELKDTSSGSPYCLKETTPNSAKACKWEAAYGDDSWVVFGKTTVEDLTFVYDVSFEETITVPSDFCYEDLNEDNIVDSDEYGECVETDDEEDYLCLYDAAECDVQSEEAICPDDSELNTETDNCEADVIIECDAGFTYDVDLGICADDPYCSNNGIYSNSTDQCEIEITDADCPDDYTYSDQYNACIKEPTCENGGVYNSKTDRCEASIDVSCQTGYTLNSSSGLCETDPECPTGSTYNSTYDVCVISHTYSCTSDYTLNGTTCQADPVCSGSGSYNKSTNRCEASGTYECSLTGTVYTSSASCSTNCSTAGSCTSGYFNSSLCYITAKEDYEQEHTQTCGLSTCTVSGKCTGNTAPSGYMLTASKYTGTRTGSGRTGFVYTNKYWYSDVNFYMCYTVEENSYMGDLTSTTPSYPCIQSSCSTSTKCSGNTKPANARWIKRTITGRRSDWKIYNYYSVPQISYKCAKTGTIYDSSSECSEECSTSGSCSFTCQSGYSKSGGICIKNATCPSGGSLNASSDKCEYTATIDCDDGYEYDSTVGMCIQDATCDGSGVLNTSKNLCQIDIIENCPDDYTLGSSVCYSSAVCDSGTFVKADDLCELSGATTCPSSYSFSSANDNCYAAAQCFSGSSLSTKLNVCVLKSDYTCLTGLEYSYELEKCVAYPMCSNGAYDERIDGCLVDTECPYGDEYECLLYNDDFYCSQLECYSTTDDTTVVNDTEGDNDKEDDGEETEEEGCTGTIYIFNGNDKRCRSDGLEIAWGDCCENDSYGADIFNCSDDEELIMTLRTEGKCHYVGEYCSKELDLLVGSMCVEYKKVFCCFSSMLARIIHEQGRPTLTNFANRTWGTVKSPKCRGFTISEFSSIDFKEVDFTEWATSLSVEVSDNVTTSVADGISSYYEDED